MNKYSFLEELKKLSPEQINRLIEEKGKIKLVNPIIFINKDKLLKESEYNGSKIY